MAWRASGSLLSARHPDCRDLLELLARVSDGRPGQGRDHPVAAVLALAAAAVVAGSRFFTAITGWAADVPASVRERPVPAVRGRGARGPAAVESHNLAGGHRGDLEITPDGRILRLGAHVPAVDDNSFLSLESITYKR